MNPLNYAARAKAARIQAGIFYALADYQEKRRASLKTADPEHDTASMVRGLLRQIGDEQILLAETFELWATDTRSSVA